MMPASPRWNRIAFVIAAACAAGLLAFSVRRAVSFPFTHDESLSFTMLDWPARMRDKASNHHLLNTLAMRAGRALFGVEPWSLRLGSLAAHAVYLGAALAFVRRLRSPVVGLCAFGLLALNPFVLDFFFLARGYGPASAFLLLGLLCLVCAQHDARRIGGRPAALVFLAATCAALSALANLAFLHASVPLLAGCAWVLLNGASLRPIERRRIPPLLALVAGAGLFAAAILPRILEMQRIGQLYFGGRSGLVADTLGSLVASSMYDRRLADPARELLAWSLLAVPALLGLAVLGVRASGQEGAPRSGLLLALLSGALAMPVLQHALFGTNYPIERAALYLVPLWSLAVASALDVLAAPAARPGSRRAALAFAGTLLAASAGHLAGTASTRACHAWAFDAHGPEVLAIVERDWAGRAADRPAVLACSWVFEPALNFYRVTRGLDWLAPVSRDTVGTEQCDYVYALQSDLGRLEGRRLDRLASYPDTRAVLLRATAPGGR